MTGLHREGHSGEGGDRDDVVVPTPFSVRVAEIYKAPPLSLAERRAFDSALMERIATSDRSSRWSRPSLGFALAPMAAAAAALLLLWILPQEETKQRGQETGEVRMAIHEPVDERTESAAATEEPGSLQESVIAVATRPVSDPDAGLPDDYVAIGSLFFGS